MTGLVLHAGCVAIGGRGVLIEGRSGAGKSDLALRLIDRGAMLVSDDYTELTASAGRLCAAPPARLAGLIEVRGIGIVDYPFLPTAVVALVVAIGTPLRLPEPASRVIAGLAMPLVMIAALEPAAPLKVELALDRFGARP